MRIDSPSVLISLVALTIALLHKTSSAQTPLGAAFTYQGQLKQGGSPLTGTADLQLKLFTASAAGTQIGSTQIAPNIAVSAGLFAVSVDFGAAAFDGNERWMEIAVTAPSTNGIGPFTTLTPRQRLSAAPYALRALNAAVSGTQAGLVNFNNASNAFTGTFTGSGAALTSLSAANISSGTAGINISGNAATASTAGNVSGVVGVSNGGTGASNAAMALANLGAASSSHSHALSSLSGTLSASQLPSGGAWPLSSTLNLDSNTIAIDAANNRVGVGTASPSDRLHVVGSMLVTNIAPGPMLRLDGGDTNGEWRMWASPRPLPPILDVSKLRIASATGSGAGTDRMVIQEDGNVGIGTSVPSARLDIAAGASNTHFTVNPGTLLGVNNASAVTLDTPGTGTVAVWDNFVVNNNVGVGTSNPTERLTIAGGMNIDDDNANNGSVANSLRFGAGGSGEAIASNRQPGANQWGLDFFTGSIPRMSITVAGNVGIGTTNPQATLDVNGTVKAQNMPGVEFVSGPLNLNFGPGTTDFSSIVVDVPSSGYLIVSADVNLILASLGGTLDFSITGIGGGGLVSEFMSPGGSKNLSITRVMPVNAGPVTLGLRISNVPGAGTVLYRGLTATYVPNRY